MNTQGTNQTSTTGAAGSSSFGGAVNSGMANSTGASNMGSTSGTVSVQQISQQLKTLQQQLRQTQTSGPQNEAYTDAANRLQDVYELLNKIQ